MAATYTGSTVDAPAVPSRSGRRWRIAAITLVAILALATLVALGWWQRHPRAFPDAGGWTVENSKWKAGQTFYVGVTFPDDHTDKIVHVDNAAASVVSDTADTKTAILVCTISKAGGIGAGDQDMVNEYCSRTEPATDVTLSLGNDPRQQLILALTPTKPGIVKTHGINVTYSDGWQHGTQLTSGDVVLPAHKP